jgi:hypothetical protein
VVERALEAFAGRDVLAELGPAVAVRIDLDALLSSIWEGESVFKLVKGSETKKAMCAKKVINSSAVRSSRSWSDGSSLYM